MITELFGLPGVGKSTYADVLVRDSEYVHVNLYKRNDILFWCFVAFGRFPRVFIKHFIWCFRHNTSWFYIWNFFCIRIAKYTKASFSKSHVVLDEGPIQNLLSFPNKKVDEKSIRQFLSSLPDSGEVILLTVAEEVRQRRLQQRPYVTWRQKQNSIINYDDVMKCNHDLLVSIVSVQERFNLIENNESTT